MTDSATLDVYNPMGAISTALPHAPRLNTLAGKTICELSNAHYRHDETFSLIRQLVQKRFPNVTFVPYTEFPLGMDKIDSDDIGDIVVAKGCQAVIGGNAG